MNKRDWPVQSPCFYAWADEQDRLDAFEAALSALAAGGRLDLGMTSPPYYDDVTPAEAVAALRSRFAPEPTGFISLGILPCNAGVRSNH